MSIDLASQAMISKATFYEPTIDNVNKLVEYLASIVGKETSLSSIRQSILKTKWLHREKQLRSRSHVQAAIYFLKYLIKNGKQPFEGEDIKTVIADLIPYISTLDKSEDVSFIVVSTNTLPSTIHYKHAKWLFYKNQLPDARNRYNLDLMVLYVLRLSLEQRVLGFLGIDFVVARNKPVSLTKLLKIVKKLENVKYAEQINWDEIEWVYDWLNHYMHRHLRPYPWVIHQSFEILNSVLESSQIIRNKTTHLSFYASTIVQDEDKLQTEIEKEIVQMTPDAKIQWRNHREILKI